MRCSKCNNEWISKNVPSASYCPFCGYSLDTDNKTLIIEDQIWMAANLDVDSYQNGDLILFSRNQSDWDKITKTGKGCWSYPAFNEANIGSGKMYNYYAVIDKRGLAPEGYRISHIDDWNNLINKYGGWDKIEDAAFNLIVALKLAWFKDKDVNGGNPSYWNISGVNDLLIFKVDNIIKGIDCDFGEKAFVRCLKTNKSESIYQIEYQSVIIGKQEWMTKNLDVSHFRNGDPIPEIKTHEDFINARDNGLPGWCYYDNNPENGKKYGKLYNWHAVNDPRGLAPNGWHIPTKDDWNKLTNNIIGIRERRQFALKLMKPNAWNDNEDATNESGFSALPGGERGANGGYMRIGRKGIWWSISIEVNQISDNEEEGPVYFSIAQRKSEIYTYFIHPESFENYASVRCLKDL